MSVVRVLSYRREDGIDFCRRSGLRAGKFTFVNKASDLIGTRNALIILVDGWENRRDKLDLIWMMKNRDSICLSPVDIGGDPFDGEEYF